MKLTRQTQRLAALALIATLPLLSGCIERKIRFTLAEPMNVPVRLYVDGEDMGELSSDSPIESDFVHYGPREYSARADGYEVAAGEYNTDPPWFEYPPMDFFVLLWPQTWRYEHEVEIRMTPLQEVDPVALADRAEAFRESSRERISEAQRRPKNKRQ